MDKLFECSLNIFSLLKLNVVIEFTILSHFNIECFLNVYFPSGSLEPPKFVKKLEAATMVKQGDSCQLECKISGSPEIKIVWYKNDQEIHASDKHHTIFSDSTAALVIVEANPEDSGDYICEALNSAGTASCSTTVTVKG